MISYLDINNIDKITNSFINKEYLINEFNNNPYAKCIIYEEDKVLGYLYYSDIYDRIEINQIEVLESQRGKGIGSKLLKYLVDNNTKSITLEVKETNNIAIKLYKKYGFKEVAKREKYYQGIDGILMERKSDNNGKE